MLFLRVAIHVLVAVLTLALAADPAAAQQATRVSRAQSSLLLDMPGLADEFERYDYLGWDASYRVEGHYAYHGSLGGSFPRAQVHMAVLVPGTLWTRNSVTEQLIRGFPFFKERKLELLPASRNISTDYVKTLLFRTGDAECVAFSIRRLSTPGGAGAVDVGTRGFSGIYCGAPGQSLTADLVTSALGGIYYREKGKILRAYELDTRPIPDRVLRPGSSGVAPSSTIYAQGEPPVQELLIALSEYRIAQSEMK